MTGAGRYAELAAAVRSFKADLLQPGQVERLVETGSLSETVSLLTGGRVSATDTSDLPSVESSLVQKAIELSSRLAAYTPHDSRPLIKLFAARYELECVKEILRSIADQADPEEAMKHIIPAGKLTPERCKELLEARNPNRVVEAVEDEALKRLIAPLVSGERGGGATVFAIDQYYYGRLWAASNLPDPLDTQTARGLVGEAIDCLNILLAFRARLTGLDARSASDIMIPANYALGRALEELAEGASAQNLMRALDKTPYARAIEGLSRVAGDGGISRVELALNRSHALSCRNAFAGSPFNVGLALAFLFLKAYELRDMFAIINGKANKVPADQVMSCLILTAT
mgnify:FL=1